MIAIPEIHGCYVALHHRTERGDGARHVEEVGAWLSNNANSFFREVADDWIAIGIAPTNVQASKLLDAFQAELDQ
jgi:hypothetical protein